MLTCLVSAFGKRNTPRKNVFNKYDYMSPIQRVGDMTEVFRNNSNPIHVKTIKGNIGKNYILGAQKYQTIMCI